MSNNHITLSILLIWRHPHYLWRAAKFRPMLGAQGLWAGRYFHPATPVTRNLGFSGLIWRTAPFSRLMRYTRGCGGSILTQIPRSHNSVAQCDTRGDADDLFFTGSSQIYLVIGKWRSFHRCMYLVTWPFYCYLNILLWPWP
jgi:hypothetical protein